MLLDLCRDMGTGKMEIGGVGHVAAALQTWAKMMQAERQTERRLFHNQFSAQTLRSPFIVVDK